MKTRFRMGSLHVSPSFLEAVPRPVMVRAIVEHFSTQPDHDGQPMRSTHEHGGRRFVVETPGRRDRTYISLI